VVSSQRRVPAARTNSSAIAALVCGVLALFGLAPIGIAAVILGHKALRQIRRNGGDGRGLAMAGLILGYLALALAVLGLLVMLAMSHAVPGTPPAPQP
jgi:phosphotransferase system  glucose/maltose/N-acetylglucosamine-specific IIC component